jgi:hypothetical protein
MTSAPRRNPLSIRIANQPFTAVTNYRSACSVATAPSSRRAMVADNNAVAPKFPRLSERLHFASLQRKYPLKSSPPQSNLLLGAGWSGVDQAAQYPKYPKWPMLHYRNK